MDDDQSNAQAWAYQLEVEQRMMDEEFDYRNDKELENYGDKHGI